VWGILFYGDEDFVSDVKPLLSYTFHLDDSFYFTMGYLNNEDRHYMLDAIQSEELEYTRQIDYGFQVLLKNRYSRFDTWLNWNLLNTPEQREYLDIGTNLFLYIFNFIFNVQGYWSHHGGELFQSEPVQNFYQLALGIENFYTINTRILTKVGYKLYYLADREKIEAIPGSTGKGFSGELYFYLRNFKLYFDYWKGDNFITEEGDPLYRTDGWIFGGVRNETRISNITDFILDLRLHYFEDNEVFSYEYRFEFKTALGYRIKK
jgi:hypothetical protein